MYFTMAENNLYYVYIMTNTYNTVLYTGVTNDICRRLLEHRNRVNPKSFTSRYNIHKLVWYECFLYVEEAIVREKQIKAGSRRKKISLINKTNKDWNNLQPFKPKLRGA